MWTIESRNAIEVSVELIGEVRDHPATGKPIFDRGITNYPFIGAIAHRIRSRDLRRSTTSPGASSVTIGQLSQDESIDACIAIDDTLNRHFAVLGTTGVGKSTAVSLLLRKAIEARPDLRVLILDPHNEFAPALPEYAIRIDTNSLDLPFWLFRLEEFTEVLFRGREAVPEEVDLLRELIPLAKHAYRNPPIRRAELRRGGDAITADTPIPYRMADLLQADRRAHGAAGEQERPAGLQGAAESASKRRSTTRATASCSIRG